MEQQQGVILESHIKQHPHMVHTGQLVEFQRCNLKRGGPAPKDDEHSHAYDCHEGESPHCSIKRSLMPPFQMYQCGLIFISDIVQGNNGGAW